MAISDLQEFKGKRVLVMGLGLHGGGAGTVLYFIRAGARVTVTDLRPASVFSKSVRAIRRSGHVRFVLGQHRMSDFIHADLIVKNPGVLPNSPYLKKARAHGVEIASDIGIFFRHCPALIIGITGTRGKSTASWLLWRFLSKNTDTRKRYQNVFLAGNIRRSVLEILPQISENDLVILELSSFQLYDLRSERKSPGVAIWTNMQRDHLNWHKTFAEYIRAKSAIFKFQEKKEILFIPARDAVLRKISKKAPSRVIRTDLPASLRTIVAKNIGPHYIQSVGLAAAAAMHFGVALKTIRRELLTFRGLPGRQELISKRNGVHWINDTTATTPDAAIAALRRFHKYVPSRGHLILIAGGSDKKLDFRKLAKEIRRLADTVIFLPGTATNQLRLLLTGAPELIETSSMAEAVRTAARIAHSGDYALLSPGAASFGLFLNEFDRGDAFVKEIQKLK